MTMLAGSITLEHLTPDVYQHLEILGDRLRQGVREACAELEVAVQVTGLSSLFGIHFVDRPVRSWRDVAAGDKGLGQRVFWGLMNEGIMCAPSLVGCVSSPMGEAEVDSFVRAFSQVLARNHGT